MRQALKEPRKPQGEIGIQDVLDELARENCQGDVENRQAVDSSDCQQGKFGHRQRKRHHGEYRHRPILRKKDSCLSPSLGERKVRIAFGQETPPEMMECKIKAGGRQGAARRGPDGNSDPLAS